MSAARRTRITGLADTGRSTLTAVGRSESVGPAPAVGQEQSVAVPNEISDKRSLIRTLIAYSRRIGNRPTAPQVLERSPRRGSHPRLFATTVFVQ
jgi:hypothetical protein